jgi:hypothetical protein
MMPVNRKTYIPRDVDEDSDSVRWVPTPEEIAARRKEVQSWWSDQDREKRSVVKQQPSVETQIERRR